MSDPLKRLEQAVRKAQAEAKRNPKKVLRPSEMRTENGGARERRVAAAVDAINRARKHGDPLDRCDGCEKPRETTRFRVEFKAKLCDGCHDGFVRGGVARRDPADVRGQG